MTKPMHLPDSGFARLSRRVETSREQANRQGERFNIFSILGMQRDETRTHSRFLAELLSPKGRHGEGSVFLRDFIHETLGLQTEIGLPVRVTRELPTEAQRRVDLVVETSELLLGIEVKVDADDQPAQLFDYYRELEQRARGRKDFVLVYLTLNGKAPSARSLNGLPPGQVLCLSFAQDVRHWLQRCHALSLKKPELAHAIMQYQRLIETLTGADHSMTSILARQLSHNSEDLKTALAVQSALPKAKSAVMLRFWQELCDRLEQALGISAEVYNSRNLRTLCDDFCHGRKESRHVGIRIPLLCTLNGEVLYLYTNLFKAVHYGLRLVDKQGQPVAVPEAKRAVVSRRNDGNAKANENGDWLICYYHAPEQSADILDFHRFNDAVLDLVDDEHRGARVHDMVAHQLKLVDLAREVWAPEQNLGT